MNIEDSLVILGFLLLAVARSNEFLGLTHAVRVSLCSFWEEERASKESARMYMAGRAAVEPCSGRAVLAKNRKLREFNPTRGYPGQDIVS